MKRKSSQTKYCEYRLFRECYRDEFRPTERNLRQRSRRGKFPAYFLPDGRKGPALFSRREVVNHIAQHFGKAFPDMLAEFANVLGVKAEPKNK